MDNNLRTMPFNVKKYETVNFEIIRFNEINNPLTLPNYIKIDKFHYIDFHAIFFCLKCVNIEDNIIIDFKTYNLKQNLLSSILAILKQIILIELLKTKICGVFHEYQFLRYFSDIKMLIYRSSLHNSVG